jgi:hypothetical protein
MFKYSSEEQSQTAMVGDFSALGNRLSKGEGNPKLEKRNPNENRDGSQVSVFWFPSGLRSSGFGPLTALHFGGSTS